MKRIQWNKSHNGKNKVSSNHVIILAQKVIWIESFINEHWYDNTWIGLKSHSGDLFYTAYCTDKLQLVSVIKELFIECARMYSSTSTSVWLEKG